MSQGSHQRLGAQLEEAAGRMQMVTEGFGTGGAWFLLGYKQQEKEADAF